MIWRRILGGFITEKNSVQSVSISSTDIYDEASCESSLMDAVEPAVEDFLSSRFTWLLEVVVMSIWFCGRTVRVETSFILLSDEVALGVVFCCGWVAENCKIFLLRRLFSESRSISAWRTSIILRFMLSFSLGFDFSSKLLRERWN